jgi:hypothetical protein
MYKKRTTRETTSARQENAMRKTGNRQREYSAETVQRQRGDQMCTGGEGMFFGACGSRRSLRPSGIF